MATAGPTRLYATLVGAGLVVYGIAGFFFDSSFASPDGIGEALGLLSVNGWANCFHILTGAAGLLVTGFAARSYAIGVTALYAAVAILAALT